MTEQEWLDCALPNRMLEFLRGKASDRKLRLFAVACCRRIWDLLKDASVEQAMILLEQRADGSCDKDRLHNVLAGLQEKADGLPPSTMAYQGRMGIILTAACTAPGDAMFILGLYSLANAVAWQSDPDAMIVEDDWTSPHDHRWREVRAGERNAQAALLRDIFGNPFRPVAVEPLWLIPTVIFLARMIYDERSFDQMPELADSLEAAGCNNEDILAHCRDGSHVRGCWVVDLLLGKE